MSSNTKIIVLKSKELIYTGIFIILGVLLVLLLFYMFSPNDKPKQDTASTEAVTTYAPGIYTSSLNLGGAQLQVCVTVDKDTISHVDIKNLDETVTAMYPLITPSLDEINSQITSVSSLNEITYSSDTQYTSIIIMEAVKQALIPAEVK
ncbi:MAG: hypothetical protein NC225_11070 [Clostridium sp.]|nr:hypothetical protein [Clostridium sp.]MCM1400006.1 hypothetical protein [Clostridium sp.]MCM1459777.1 hypothetical protein [Bacteroides sp.]